MRWLARLLIAASLTGLSWWMIQSAAIVRWLSTPTVSGLPVELLADARRSIAYPLSTDDWLSFPLLPGGGRLRLLTNAQLPRALADPAVSEPEQWSYALRYRVLDLADRVLSSDVLNLRTEISLVELAGAGRLMTIHQAPGDAAIADGRVLYLADPGLEATMLQLRLEPLSAPVIGAVARAYQRQQVPEHQLGYQWQRLSGDVRQQLAEASVHGGELLSEYERRALLRSRWLPLAPSGVLGRDYQSVTLYQLKDEVGVPVEPPVPPPGLIAGPGTDAVVAIPAPGGRVRLTLTPIDPAAPDKNEDVIAELQWIGRPATRRASWKHPLTADFEAELEAGLLILRLPEPVAVRVWIETSDTGEALELTPEARYLRGWVVGPERSLRFRVAHLAHEPTPWRLDLRSLRRSSPDSGTLPTSSPSPLSETTPPMPFRVRYQWLDARDRVLEEGDLAASPLASHLDRLPLEPEARVSEVETFYFRLPPAVASLVLTSAEPVVAAAATRPPELPRVVVAPPRETDTALSLDETSEQALRAARPDWFFVRPPDWAERQRVGQSALLTWQPHPPELDTELLSGRFRFESFRPDGRWRGRYLLLPAPTTPFRAEALGSRFLVLNSGETRWLNLASRAGPVDPGLLFLNESGTQVNLALRIGEESLLEWTRRGRSGLTSLPPMAPGLYPVELEAPQGVRAMLSHTIEAFEPGNQAWSRRFGLLLDDGGLSIPIEKPRIAATILSLRLYGFLGDAGPQRLRVKLRTWDHQAPSMPMLEPFREWTFLEQELELGPAPFGSVRVLQAPNEEVDGGTLAFISLGTDLDAGKYRLSVELEQGLGGYLMLSMAEPGQFPWARFRREP